MGVVELVHETIELENGNKLHYKSEPRHGMFTVNFDKGGTPPSLQGHFLNLDDLKKRVNEYLANRPKNPTKPAVEKVKSDG